ncbi:hypothetical protein Poly51_06250 [Rubripirellula tenax]|uniref:Uncharacterized protein n=1 Tax=Rubripirellula tenax TaxID=2528015 RepID=A0A5C6FHI8_9BACT|nr:hypothetical protein Poly51_06250 [Rubripirellula tenax]
MRRRYDLTHPKLPRTINWPRKLAPWRDDTPYDILFFCCNEINISRVENGMNYVEATGGPESMQKWVNKNYDNLNIFTDANNIPMEINKRVFRQSDEIFSGSDSGWGTAMIAE